MATRLPPPPRPLPSLRPGDVFAVATGSVFGRIYLAGGRHPASWSTFRSFGPVSQMRFDHHPPPPRVHPSRAISYVAPGVRSTGAANATLATCLRETFGSTGVVDLSSGEPWFTLWRSTRELRLLDLIDSPWIGRCGGNAAISSGARGPSRQWSNVAWRTYPDVDGLYYQSSYAPALRSAALYERSMTALPAAPGLNRPLSDPRLRSAIFAVADTYGMVVRP